MTPVILYYCTTTYKIPHLGEKWTTAGMISWFQALAKKVSCHSFIIICYNLNKEIPFKVAKLTYDFHSPERTIHLKESRIDTTETPLQFRFYSVNFRFE